MSAIEHSEHTLFFWAILASLMVHSLWLLPVPQQFLTHQTDRNQRQIRQQTADSESSFRMTQTHWIEANDIEVVRLQPSEPSPTNEQSVDLESPFDTTPQPVSAGSSKTEGGIVTTATGLAPANRLSTTNQRQNISDRTTTNRNSRSAIRSARDQVSEVARSSNLAESSSQKPKSRNPNLLSFAKMRADHQKEHLQARAETARAPLSSTHSYSDRPSRGSFLFDKETAPSIGGEKAGELQLRRSSRAKRLQFGKFEVHRAEDGTLEYFAPNGDFNAIITKDGSVEFETRTAVPTTTCLLGVCIAAGALRKPGEQRRDRNNRLRIRFSPVPIGIGMNFGSKHGMAASQLEFLQATENYRFSLAIQQQERRILTSLKKLDATLDRIWRKRKISFLEKRATILQLSDESGPADEDETICHSKPIPRKSKQTKDTSDSVNSLVMQLDQLRIQAALRTRRRILQFARNHTESRIIGGFTAHELAKLESKVKLSALCDASLSTPSSHR